MKLATYLDPAGAQKIGAVIDGDSKILDLQAAATAAGGANPAFASMQALIEAGEAGLAAARALVAKPEAAAVTALSAVKLLAPLPRPISMRDFLTFEEHIGNAMKKGQEVGIFPTTRVIPDAWYEAPRYYKCNAMNIAGPGADIQWPSYSQRMDYELELGWVVGKKGRDIAREDALSYLFGFTIYNDLTARDALFSEMGARLGPAKGKDFDGGNVLGPWIVTMDEIGDPHDLEMTAHVNGAEWSRGNSGQAYHKIEDCIVHLSKDETLHPGEVLGSGTVGTGCGIEQDKWLQDGDTIALTVEKIGTLSVRVHGPSARPYAETMASNVKFKH